MSLSQLLPRMKRELEILERDPPPGIVCYPVDDSLLHFCAQVKGPKDTPYEDGLFKIDVQIPSRYPMEPPKMQFITPIYHPNVDDAGRICLDILKMPPKGSWKPSLNISTTLTSLSVLMADPNPDDPLLVEIASEFKENNSLFLKKARQATLKNAVDDKKALNPVDIVQESEQASSSTSASSASVLSSSPNFQQESATLSIQNKVSSEEAPQEAAQDVAPKNLNKTEGSDFHIITQRREKKKILSLSKSKPKIKKKEPLEQISNQPVNVPTVPSVPTSAKTTVPTVPTSAKTTVPTVPTSAKTIVPTVSTSVKTTASRLKNDKLLKKEEVKQVEKRRTLSDITKKSINVPPVSNQASTTQTQLTEKNLVLNKAERKRLLLRKKTSDVPSKKQKN